MVRYSVIIPVYNAEKTLRRCVDSLLNQNCSDMELILVNDGSPDGSGAICEEYADRYPCVVYINKPNGGVSTARNAGLDAAKGKYVLFVDSDDYVSENYFHELEALGEDFDYDCIFFSLAFADGIKTTYRILKPIRALSAELAVPIFCEALYKKYLTSPINKRYTRSIIEKNHIRFPEHLYVGEDKSFSLKYVMYCHSCRTSPEVLYNVSLENNNSLSRRPRPDLYDQLKMLSEFTQQTLRTVEIHEEYRRQFYAAESLVQLRGVYSEAKRMHLANQDRKYRRKTIREMCRTNNALRAELPRGMFSKLLQIPVRMQMVTVIDLMGWYLARG